MLQLVKTVEAPIAPIETGPVAIWMFFSEKLHAKYPGSTYMFGNAAPILDQKLDEFDGRETHVNVWFYGSREDAWAQADKLDSRIMIRGTFTGDTHMVHYHQPKPKPLDRYADAKKEQTAPAPIAMRLPPRGRAVRLEFGGDGLMPNLATQQATYMGQRENPYHLVGAGNAADDDSAKRPRPAAILRLAKAAGLAPF